MQITYSLITVINSGFLIYMLIISELCFWEIIILKFIKYRIKILLRFDIQPKTNI